MPQLEEDLACLMETLRLPYSDLHRMPYSRRRRLIEWKQELNLQRKAQEEARLKRRK